MVENSKDELDINEMVSVLKMFVQIAAPLKTSLKMKSNIQTYDMRDNKLYKGVIEIEEIIKLLKEKIGLDEDLALKIS